jgi:RNA polymerase sigma factor (sigma-70 family)
VSVARLEALYRERYEHFARVAGAIAGDAESGHDAVQLGFASALRHRGSFRDDGPLEAWVWRIVVNEAKRLARSRVLVAEAADEPVANGAAHDEHGLRPWIAALPERQRAALFLRYYADLPYAQIAEILDMEVGTVSATLSAAHARLRQSFSEVES